MDSSSGSSSVMSTMCDANTCKHSNHHNHHQPNHQPNHHFSSQHPYLLAMFVLILAMMIQTSEQSPIQQQQSNQPQQSQSNPVDGQPSMLINSDPDQLTSSLMMMDKRASGFLPMRGRKSYPGQAMEPMASYNNDAETIMDGSSAQMLASPDELELMDLMEKRSRQIRGYQSGFMPMRGRKSDPYVIPSPARLSYYYANAPSPQQQQQAMFKSIINGIGPNPLYEPTSKRGKGVAFFGARGKRSLVMADAEQ